MPLPADMLLNENKKGEMGKKIERLTRLDSIAFQSI